MPRGARPPGRPAGATTTTTTTTGGPVDGMWDWNELRPYHVDIEVNPFTGRPFFDEVLFYHAPSKSLLTLDFYWNYPGGTARRTASSSTSSVPITSTTRISVRGSWPRAWGRYRSA